MYHILIVEDDDEINKLLSDFLAKNGYIVTSRYDGLHVLDCLKEHKVDLILLDLMLPYRSGDLLLADIRKQYTVPVIVISARETTQNKIDLLRLGADDYITKPFDMEEMLARIESSLRRVQYQAAPCSRLEYQNLILDVDKKTGPPEKTGAVVDGERICHSGITDEVSGQGLLKSKFISERMGRRIPQ